MQKKTTLTVAFFQKKKNYLILDYLKIKLAKASKFVANSIKELEEGLYPEATHVIYDEAEEINRKAGKIQLKNKAIKKSLSMSLDEKISIIQILRNKNLKGQSQDFVDVVIDEIIETEAENFLKYEKMDKAEVYIRAVILEAIFNNGNIAVPVIILLVIFIAI